jgi:hypothetical protein
MKLKNILCQIYANSYNSHDELPFSLLVVWKLQSDTSAPFQGGGIHTIALRFEFTSIIPIDYL